MMSSECITDVRVGFQFRDYTVHESMEAISVCVVLTGEIERSVEVYMVTNDTKGEC